MFLRILPALAATIFLGAGTAPAPSEPDPRALMLQARFLQREDGGNDPKAAAALYRKVITLVPNSSQAYLRLSEALLVSGSFPASVEPARKATELDPRSGEAWAHLALLYYRQQEDNASYVPIAVAALKQAVKLLPSDYELGTYLAQDLDLLKDQEGALKAWLAVGRLKPTAIWHDRLLSDFAWERAMELAIQLRNYDARREAVLALCDRSFPGQRFLGFLKDLARDQADSGFLGHAEESFQLLGQFYPQEATVWENIAFIQLKTSQYEKALATLSKAESIRKSPRTSFFLGLCLMKLGSFPEAEVRWKALLPALEASPEDASLMPQVKEYYATCLLLSGRPRALLELIAPWPEAMSSRDLFSLRTQALIQVEDWKQARAALKDGIVRFPEADLFHWAAELPPKTLEEPRLFQADSRQALQQLNLEAMAGMWAEFRCWSQCLATVQDARKAAPVRDVDLLLLQANALQNLGQPDQAIQVLREGQKLNPKHATLQNNLGFSLLEKGGNLEEAARLIQAALAQDPKNSATMDSWGWVLFNQGKYAEAETTLRKAAELDPSSPELHQHLGETLLKLDRLQEALDEWDRALAYAFPQRKALEEQAQALRIRLARNRAAEDEAPAGNDTPDDAGDGEEEP